MEVFVNKNAVDKFVTVENIGKTDAYVRTIIAFESGSLTEARFDEVINTSVFMMDEGVWVGFGSDIAAGAHIAMPNVIAMSIRASKLRAMMDEKQPRYLSVAEAYYLGSAAGAQYFDPRPIFSPGTNIHAVVVDESNFNEPAGEISMLERFERAIYRMTADDVTAVWSEGRLVKSK